MTNKQRLFYLKIYFTDKWGKVDVAYFSGYNLHEVRCRAKKYADQRGAISWKLTDEQ